MKVLHPERESNDLGKIKRGLIKQKYKQGKLHTRMQQHQLPDWGAQDMEALYTPLTKEQTRSMRGDPHKRKGMQGVTLC